MKELSIKIKNQLKKLIKKGKVNPRIYWTNLLVIFFIIIIILIIFSFYLLYQIKNQQTFQTTSVSTKTPVIINDKLFESVEEYFISKKIKESDIKSGLRVYKDPSIN